MKCTGNNFNNKKEEQKKNDSSKDNQDGRIVFFHSYLLRNSRTKTGKNGKKIVRELCFDDDLFFGAGMQKFQFTCMKALAFQALVRASGTIEAVPKQGMPDGGKVDANLVCSAGLKIAADMRITVITGQYRPAGQCRT